MPIQDKPDGLTFEQFKELSKIISLRQVSRRMGKEVPYLAQIITGRIKFNPELGKEIQNIVLKCMGEKV